MYFHVCVYLASLHSCVLFLSYKLHDVAAEVECAARFSFKEDSLCIQTHLTDSLCCTSFNRYELIFNYDY